MSIFNKWHLIMLSKVYKALKYKLGEEQRKIIRNNMKKFKSKRQIKYK